MSANTANPSPGGLPKRWATEHSGSHAQREELDAPEATQVDDLTRAWPRTPVGGKREMRPALHGHRGGHN